MKSMRKSLNMSKVLGSFKKKSGGDSTAEGAAASPPAATPQPGATPEITVQNNVKAFCESGNNAQGEEVLFLPLLVDAAESSPAAAAEAARIIRKFLSKEYGTRPSWQYNALMLVRILTDNPGETFTRNLAEPEFVEAVRKLLKHSRDSGVRQMVMDTLNDFETTKMYDENLKPLIELWQHEKAEAYKKHWGGGSLPPTQRRTLNAPPANPHSQNYFARSHTNKKLPDTVELASRLEEARTSAKLLEQVVLNTPPHEMLDNDLIKEFADRCLSASRSIQGYMVSENPAPDNDTMESLIDTNEQLQTALMQHQRAVLNARKQLGLHERTPDATPGEETNGRDRVLEWQQGQDSHEYLPPNEPPPNLPLRPADNGKGKETFEPYGNAQASGSGYDRHQTDHQVHEDPFRDPQPHDHQDQPHAYEPFHPGFNSTPSYINRQESAVGKVTMHGAEPDPVSAAPLPSGTAPQPPRKVIVEDDDDLYDAEPRHKEPMHRY